MVLFPILTQFLPTVCLLALHSFAVSEAAVLEGRVVDDRTGAPLPCRLYILAKDGTFHFAKSAANNGSAVKYDKQRGDSVERHTTLSAHPFQTELPPGEYRFTAERGKEYHTATKTIRVGPAGDGKPQTVVLRLTRWIDAAGRGWYSGDTHVHRSLEELPNVLLAEDLNVALPLTHWVTKSHTPPTQGDKNTAAAEKPALIEVDRTHVVWPLNTEYEIFTVGGKRHTLGAVFILNHTEPFKMGAPPVAPIAAEARRQHALLDLDKHSWPWSLMLLPVMDVDLFELSNNHIWRTQFHFNRWTTETRPEFLDVETDDSGGFTERGWRDFGFGVYYALLNMNFRMRPTAGTASGVHPVPLGFGRVYVHLPDGFSYKKWIAGLDAGRSFVTTGPMLFINTNNRPPGHTFKNAKPVEEGRITGTAESAATLNRIEILINGEVVRTVKPTNKKTDRGGYITRIEEVVPFEGTSWTAVRCFEKQPDGRERFAHTSPVWHEIPDRPLHPKRAEVRYFIQRMQEELARNREVLRGKELAEYTQALETFQRILNTAR